MIQNSNTEQLKLWNGINFDSKGGKMKQLYVCVAEIFIDLSEVTLVLWLLFCLRERNGWISWRLQRLEGLRGIVENGI